MGLEKSFDDERLDTQANKSLDQVQQTIGNALLVFRTALRFHGKRWLKSSNVNKSESSGVIISVFFSHYLYLHILRLRIYIKVSNFVKQGLSQPPTPC